MFDLALQHLSTIDPRIPITVLFGVISAWLLLRYGARQLAVFYLSIALLALTIGDSGTELPAAKIMANDDSMYLFLVCIIIGVKMTAAALGWFETTFWQDRARDVVFISFGVMMSIVGQHSLVSNSTAKSAANAVQIADYTRLRDSHQRRIDGDNRTLPCIRQPASVCIESVELAAIAGLNSKIAVLRSNANVGYEIAIGGIAKRFGVTAAALLFYLIFLRSLVVMYATLIISKALARTYFSITGHAPVALGKKKGRKRAKRGAFGAKRGKTGQNGATVVPMAEFKGQWAGKKYTDEQLLAYLHDYCVKNAVSRRDVTRDTVQAAVNEKIGRGIRNTRATGLGRMYREDQQAA